MNLKQKTQELQKKWSETCFNLHPSFHQHTFSSERMAPTPLSMTGLYNPNLLGRQPFQPKLQLNKNLGGSLQLNINPPAPSPSPSPAPSPALNQPSERTVSLPGSPVRTDLVLGQTKVSDASPEQTHKERIKDFRGCIPSEPQNKLPEVLQSDNKNLCQLDADSFKKLLKGLMEKVWWQQEAATSVAATMTQCKLGNGKRRGAVTKGDMWLLFMGPDRVGKKKMASALSELVSGSNPVMISLGSRNGGGESEMSFRGKTVLDRIAEAVRRNPFSVIMIEDINEADLLVRGSIKRAMERGRLADSHGREISLGNVIFILTADWLPENLKYLSDGAPLEETKLANIARGNWQLRLSLCERSAKRRANWIHDDHERAAKPRKETGSGLAFDLNEAADMEDEKADGSHNSSDLTIEHEDEHGLNHRQSLTGSSSVPRELLDNVDDAIVFKPVDIQPIRSTITNSITKGFSSIVGDRVSLEVEENAVEKILGGIWLGRTGLEEWTAKVLVPSFQRLKSSLPAASSDESSMVVRLESDGDSDSRRCGDWLPGNIKVVVTDAGC